MFGGLNTLISITSFLKISIYVENNNNMLYLTIFFE